MSDAERRILKVLRKKLLLCPKPLNTVNVPWMNATWIGIACGKSHAQASAWACRHLKKLRNRGLVKREPPGAYLITEKGIAELEKTP